MGEIRDVAPQPGDPDRFYTSTFDGLVTSWNLSTSDGLAPFQTVYEFGGKRLAACRAGRTEIVLAAAWAHHGICAYTTDGSVLWAKQLRNIQTICPISAAEYAVVCRADGPAQILDAGTGSLVDEWRGIRDAFANDAGDRVIAVESTALQLRTSGGERLWSDHLRGFAVLSAAFSNEAVAISEVAGHGEAPVPLTIRTHEGEIRGTWTPPPGSLVLELAFDAGAHEWVGLVREINHERTDHIVRWTDFGTVSSERDLGLISHDDAFLPGGERLVLAAPEQVVDTRTGQVVRKLAGAPS